MATIEEFAAVVLQQTREQLNVQYPDSRLGDDETVNVHPGRVYTKVDVGPAHNMSGKYMVENATGIIYGIKGYGKVHKGQRMSSLTPRGWAVLLTLVAAAAFTWGAIGWGADRAPAAVKAPPATECRATSYPSTLCPVP